MENPKGSNQEGMTGGRGNFPILESRERENGTIRPVCLISQPSCLGQGGNGNEEEKIDGSGYFFYKKTNFLLFPSGDKNRNVQFL